MKSVFELMSLKGRAALVTGGAGHIGRAICEALAELGAGIAVLDVDEAACQKTAQDLSRRLDVRCLPLAVELTDEGARGAVCDRVLTEFDRLDVLVHCAAFVGVSKLDGWATTFERQSPAVFRQALDLNLAVPFALTQNCAKALARSGHGAVINIASIYGLVGPDPKLYEGSDLGNPAAYAASKAGLLQLTRWLATMLAPSVRVNAITPGGIRRGHEPPFLDRYCARTPLGRMGVEEELKGAAAYLASDLSSYVTGHNLVVDGGFTIW
jgi:NAD(P)-dependent dehydrogenase (short-subunit alcohol dehydrogenase family)